MTGGGYARVDSERMSKAATVFEDAAAAVRTVAGRRSVVASREGDHVWGTDETGQNFFKGYHDSSTGIFDSLDAVLELMDNLAKGTEHTAEQYRRTEQNNVQAVEAMGRSTGEAAGRTTSKRAESGEGHRGQALSRSLRGTTREVAEHDQPEQGEALQVRSLSRSVPDLPREAVRQEREGVGVHVSERALRDEPRETVAIRQVAELRAPVERVEPDRPAEGVGRAVREVRVPDPVEPVGSVGPDERVAVRRQVVGPEVPEARVEGRAVLAVRVPDPVEPVHGREPDRR